MLKRRRVSQLKHKARQANSTRRRVKMKNIHKKVIYRRRMYAMQIMDEISPPTQAQSER